MKLSINLYLTMLLLSSNTFIQSYFCKVCNCEVSSIDTESPKALDTLMQAIEKNDLATVKSIATDTNIKKRTPINKGYDYITPLEYTFDCQQWAIATYFITTFNCANYQNSSSYTSLLHKAAQHHAYDILKLLIENKAPIHSETSALLTPLMECFSSISRENDLHNITRCALLLIKHGSDISTHPYEGTGFLSSIEKSVGTKNAKIIALAALQYAKNMQNKSRIQWIIKRCQELSWDEIQLSKKTKKTLQ